MAKTAVKKETVHEVQPEVVATTKPEEKKTGRIDSIDRFRGIAVFCMIVFQFIKYFTNLGWLTRLANHSLTGGIVLFPGMTLADTIAPMFMFAIGLTYAMSFRKRVEKHGRFKAYLHFALRYLALMGLGVMMDVINKIIDITGGGTANAVDYMFISLFGLAVLAGILYLIFLIPQIKKYGHIFSKALLYILAFTGVAVLLVAIRDFSVINADINAEKYGYWLVLQSIGLAGLISLFFIEFSTLKRLICVILIMVAFTIHHGANPEVVRSIVQGGFIGGFGWASIILTGSIVSDLYIKSRKNLYIALAVIVPLAIVGGLIFDLNMRSVSPGYVLVNLGISTAIFAIVELFSFLKLKFDFLAIWGKNPILMYILEFGFIGSLTQFMPDSVLANAPVWAAIIWVVVVTAILTTFAWLLSRKQKMIRF